MNKQSKKLAHHEIAQFTPSAIKHIVFDVDETLVHGTTEIKDRVWHQLFPNRVNEVQQVNRMFDQDEPFPDGKYRQGDRYARIAYLLNLWSPSNDSYRSMPEVTALAEQFQQLIQQKVNECKISIDDVLALEKLSKVPGIAIHVVSNVPISVLRENLAGWGIAQFFESIVGTPIKKVDALKELVSKSTEASEILMVGDGGNDFGAAQYVGTQFVAIACGGHDKWPEEDFPKLRSVSELTSLLNIV